MQIRWPINRINADQYRSIQINWSVLISIDPIDRPPNLHRSIGPLLILLVLLILLICQALYTTMARYILVLYCLAKVLQAGQTKSCILAIRNSFDSGIGFIFVHYIVN